jgi:hypothetical protein
MGVGDNGVMQEHHKGQKRPGAIERKIARSDPWGCDRIGRK